MVKKPLIRIRSISLRSSVPTDSGWSSLGAAVTLPFDAQVSHSRGTHQTDVNFVRTAYRTLPDHENPSMAGWPMGGMQTFDITLDKRESSGRAYHQESNESHVWIVDSKAHDPTERRNTMYHFMHRAFC